MNRQRVNNKVRIYFLAGIAVFVCGLVLIAQYPGSAAEEGAENMVAAEEFSREEYDAVEKVFVDLVKTESPRVALAELRVGTETDERLMRSCHPIVHEIGREAYRKYQDFAESMQYRDELCNSGYLHGIIEGYFSGTDDVFEAMQTVCSRYAPHSFLALECYHGIGHGLMYYTANDLPKSLDMCAVYESNFARRQCMNGVFMENFSSDNNLHTSAYLKADDLFYPCASQKEQYKDLCYVYAPVRYLSVHTNDYVGALRWCDEAERTHRSVCAFGLGGQAMKENRHNPTFVETICGSNRKGQTEHCVDGMVNLYIQHAGSVEPAIELCGKLKKQNKKTCLSAVESQESLFAS